MATQKKVTLSPSIETAPLFAFTPDAYAKADAWHNAGKAETKAAVAFYEMLVAKGVNVKALRKPDGRAFTNMEAAAFDFTLRLYFRVKLGAKCADAIFDGVTPKETILKPTGLTVHGKAIKPQTKNNLRQSYGGAKAWGDFVRDLIAIEDANAADAAGDAAPAKAKPTPKTDKAFALATVGALVKRMKKAVEKQDGSMTPEQMKKFAAWVEDGLKALAIK